MARIQKAARTYGLDMSRTAWENPAAWLSAIPSPQDRKRVSDDMALVRKARLEVAYINDLQNLTRLYTFSKTKFHVRDVELAQLARRQALERLGEAWSHYVSGASTEERKLSELLDFLQNADKPGAPERNAREPRAP